MVKQRGPADGHGDHGDVVGTRWGHGGGPRPPHLALQVQVVVEELPHLLIRVLLQGSEKPRRGVVPRAGGLSPARGLSPGPGGCPRPPTHQGVAALGQADELLVGGRAHVEAHGQHLLQGGDDQRGLDRVAVAAALLLRPLLLRATALRGRGPGRQGHHPGTAHRGRDLRGTGRGASAPGPLCHGDVRARTLVPWGHQAWGHQGQEPYGMGTSGMGTSAPRPPCHEDIRHGDIRARTPTP